MVMHYSVHRAQYDEADCCSELQKQQNISIKRCSSVVTSNSGTPIFLTWSRGSSVSMVTKLQVGERNDVASIVGTCKISCCSTQDTDRSWHERSPPYFSTSTEVLLEGTAITV